MSDSDTKYKFSINIPIFGEIPLHPADIILDLKKRDGAPLWSQFFKYGIFGVLSALVMMTITLGVKAMFPTFLDEATLPADTFALNLMIAHAIGFLPANLVAYYTNRTFVFTPGKRSPKSEMTIFTLISAVSFVGGELGVYLVRIGNFFTGENTVVIATLVFIIFSAMVNFTSRKLFVFEN